MTFGKEFVGTASYFTSAPVAGYGTDKYWRGISAGIGVGISLKDGGKIKEAIKNLKKLLKDLSMKKFKESI